MDVFIIRHAIAEDARHDAPDAERALTDKGRRRFKAVVESLDALGVQFDQILTSPWRRAAGTAEMLTRLGGDVVVTDLLAMTPGEPLLERLHGIPGEPASVACVGHEPWMSELASLLLFGERAAADKIPFKKGGVAWLQGNALRGGMELRAVLPPRWSRELSER